MFVHFPSILHVEDAILPANKRFNDTVDNWVITEKVDGSNFSLIIDRNDKSFEVAKRSNIINSPNSDIWQLWTHRERFIPFINDFVDEFNNRFSDNNCDHIVVYGEWYGPTIMRRIDYGENNDWRVFALTTTTNEDITPVAFSTLDSIVNETGYADRLVPILGFESDLVKALSFTNDGISRLSPSDSVMEGIVVCPYDVGTNIRYKSKNEKYKEKDNNSNRAVFDMKCTAEYERLKNEFKSYCTENRMYTVFSKLGFPQNSKQTGKYLSEFIADATADFIHDNPSFTEITDKSIAKAITNVGGIPYQLFKSVYNKLSC